MSTYLVPYLNFTGTTRDAMAFYESVFGGQLEDHDVRRHG